MKNLLTNGVFQKNEITTYNNLPRCSAKTLASVPPCPECSPTSRTFGTAGRAKITTLRSAILSLPACRRQSLWRRTAGRQVSRPATGQVQPRTQDRFPAVGGTRCKSYFFILIPLAEITRQNFRKDQSSIFVSRRDP